MAARDDISEVLRTALTARGDRPILFVDGRNVQRSSWPNVSDEDVVRRSCRWAREQGLLGVIVFDGRTPAVGDADCPVISVRGETADEWLIRITGQLAEQGIPYWLVTSDRELRRLAGANAARVIGGGGFLRQLADV
jgi:hypothetical protein